MLFKKDTADFVLKASKLTREQMSQLIVVLTI